MPLIKINDKTYDTDNMPAELRQLITNIQAVDTEIARMRAKISIYETARAAYNAALGRELEKITPASDTSH